MPRSKFTSVRATVWKRQAHSIAFYLKDTSKHFFWDHVERTDPARYHFRKPYKCPRCHAPQIHTHLHKEKEGLLDVASDKAMAVKSRGVSFSDSRQSNRKRSGKRQSLEALYTKMKRQEFLVCHSQLSRMAASMIELASILVGDSDQLINWFQTRGLIAQQKVCPACSHTMELQSRSDITDKYR